MNRHFTSVLSFFCLWAVFFICLPGRVDARPSLQLVENTPTHKVYEWTAPQWSWHAIVAGDQTCLMPDSLNALLWMRPGYPVLPMVSATLELHTGQQAVISLTDTIFASQELSAPLCFMPAESADLKSRFDASGSYFPADVLTSFPGKSREERFLQLTLFPVQWQTHTSNVRYLRFARIHVRLENQAPPLLAMRTSAIQWRNPLQPYLKLYLAEEGPYQVSGADLESADMALSGIEPATLQLFADGEEQPLELTGCEDGRLDPSDRIFFMGKSRHGQDGAFYHDYSDTMVYWLTWGGQIGKRYDEMAAPSNPELTDLFSDSLHYEKDLSYYSGDSDSDIHNSEKVSGEGWIWSLISRNGSAVFNFDVPGLAQEQDSVVLRMRIRGTTLDSRSPDHHVVITLNNAQVNELWFDDREEKQLCFQVPRQNVLKQNNVLIVRLLGDTPSERSQIYIDWIKVGYLRQTCLQNGWISVAIPESGSDLFVSGFAGEDAHVWDGAAAKKYAFRAMHKMWLSRLEVRSAGYADGDYAHLLRESVIVGTGSRGINLWRINPANGQLVEQKNFDTYASAFQADSMAMWIQRLPEGTLVAAAIRDEGSSRMTEAARLAVESLGSAQIRHVGARDSWVLLGKKGMASGTALESWQKSKSGPAILKTVVDFTEGGSSNAIRVHLPAMSGSRVTVFEESAARPPFRIVNYKPLDLHGGGQGADYIIITHSLFLAEARQLASHRASANHWRTMVVDVESIYDEFDNGLASPTAIKRFIEYAYHNWPKPAPVYLLFFGDASWDPKNNYKVAAPTEFVPTYGSPVSDNWFVCVDGPEDVLPDLWVGRIPVKTAQEAASSIAKILAYEQGPSGDWKKDFLFISGGFDFIEQGQFGQQSKRLIADFVEPSPTCGSGLLLHKSSDGYQEGEHRQEILDTINKGVAWVNFIGHAGSRTWDLMFHNVDIDALDNTPRFPFVTSMTCHTGRFAEPNQLSFGEYFLVVPEKGAIGFMGTSGWGYSYEDYAFLRKLFPLALQDTLRHLGELISKAKVALWQDAVANAHVRDMVYQYNLLGDPAVKLAVPDIPDVNIRATEIFVRPEIPSEADSMATVCVYVRNFGLKTIDSLTVRLSVRHPNAGEQVLASSLRIGAIGRLDSLFFQWPLRNMAGSVELVACVDPENRLIEADEANNSATRVILVLSGRIEVVSPVPFAIMPLGNTFIKVEDISTNGEKEKLVEFELDTLDTFASPFAQKSGKLTFRGLTLAWSPILLPDESSYYWRCRDLSNPDLIYEIGGTFTTAKQNVQGWSQSGRFSAGESKNVMLEEYAALDDTQTEITVASGGFYDGNFAAIYINGENVVTGGRGYNIVIMDSATARVQDIRYFDLFGDGTARQRLTEFLNTLSLGDMVLSSVRDDGSFLDDPALIAAFESIGSFECRRVGFRESWALLGIKGSPVGSAKEKRISARSGEAAVTTTIISRADSGTLLSPRIGAAARWHSMHAGGDIPADCALSIDILGQQRNTSKWDTLRTNLALNQEIDINTISAQAYPYLRLKANFRSPDRTNSPTLSNWRVLYDPVPDLAVSPAFFSLSADTVLSGVPVVLSLHLFNIGLASADSVRISFAETIAGTEERLFSRLTLSKPLTADQQVAIDQLYTPTGRPGVRLLTVRIDADNLINELSEANNVLTARVQVVADTTRPQIEITFDGRTITSGELVSSQPAIEACILDNSPLAVQDTLLINVLVDGKRLSFSSSSGADQVSLTTDQARTWLRLTPQFADGDHWLEIYYADASGNPNRYLVDFRVISALQVLSVLNYPNPFRDNTTFTFELTQSADVSIRIYTVAGRLIRIIEAGELMPGYNLVSWDGRDEEGDVIANGVYLYRVFAQSGDHHAEALQKAILMR